MEEIRRIEPHHLDLDAVLGCGAFGRVVKARISTTTEKASLSSRTGSSAESELGDSACSLTVAEDLSDSVSRLNCEPVPHYAVKGPIDRDNQDQQDAIFNEAILLASLPLHPNIVHLYAISADFETSQDRFLVLEFLSHTLKQILTRWRFCSRFSQPTIFSVMFHRQQVEAQQRQRISYVGLGIARAIKFLHSHRIVYRDIKPDNVGFADDEVKLFDFGLARRLPETNDSNSRRMTWRVGTLRYMSPESLTEYYDESADVYSFGMLLLELCVLEKPRSEIRCLDRLQKHIRSNKVPGAIRLVASSSIRKVLRACWDTNPKARPQMSTVLMELEYFCNGKPNEWT